MAQSAAAPAALDPVARIGLEDGPAEYLFDSILDVTITPADEVAVTDRSGTIRFFNLEGLWLRTVGRLGNGPGEYREPFFIGVDSTRALLIFDRLLLRLVTLDQAGNYLYDEPVKVSGTPVGAGPGVLWLENVSISRYGDSRVKFTAVSATDGRVVHAFEMALPKTDVAEANGMVRMTPSESWRRPIAIGCGTAICINVPPADTVWRIDLQNRREAVAVLPENAIAGEDFRPALLTDEGETFWAQSRAAGPVTNLTELTSARSTIRFPASFRPSRFVRNRLIGVNRDASGVERVEVYDVTRRD